jgi:hypothetical protein
MIQVVAGGRIGRKKNEKIFRFIFLWLPQQQAFSDPIWSI